MFAAQDLMSAMEFWYEFASTYSYPAAMRIQALADKASVDVVWKPFLLGPIFASQGWDDSPFNLFPARGTYMWRDLARICANERLPLMLPPARFPQMSLNAARIALSLEDGIEAFSRAVYTANFARREDIADIGILRGILERLGANAESVFETANLPETKRKLRLQTEDAVARGIFGAPSFTIGRELFWGNDRLEEAVDFARQHHA